MQLLSKSWESPRSSEVQDHRLHPRESAPGGLGRDPRLCTNAPRDTGIYRPQTSTNRIHLLPGLRKRSLVRAAHAIWPQCRGAVFANFIKGRPTRNMTKTQQLTALLALGPQFVIFWERRKKGLWIFRIFLRKARDFPIVYIMAIGTIIFILRKSAC